MRNKSMNAQRKEEIVKRKSEKRKRDKSEKGEKEEHATELD